MAAQELRDLGVVLERYPERRAELVAALGEDLLVKVEDARDVLERAAARLDEATSSDGATQS